MEATRTTQIYRSLQSYWHQRAPYQRLECLLSKSSTSIRTIKLGEGKKKTTWKLGLVKKVSVPSPKKLLLNLRDAYVSAMMVLAGSGGDGLPDEAPARRRRRRRRMPRAKRVKSSRGAKGGEFDRKMMAHMYKTLVLAPREVNSY